MIQQLPLFQRKTFPVVPIQDIPPVTPTDASSILATLPAYLRYLQSSSTSQYTPNDYTKDIQKLGVYLREKQLQEITSVDVRGWLVVLKTQEHMSEKSISRKISALSSYFSWLCSEKVLEHNPVADIPNSKVIAPLPSILFETEIIKLLATASADCRTYLLVLLLLETGLKTEEVMTIRLEHIDTTNKYAPVLWVKHVGKKMKKDRKLKLPRELVPVLEEYLATYRITDLLFPMTQRWLRYLLTSAGEKAGITKRISVQLLRDTCAVRLLQHGEPMETVLEKLGLSISTWEDAKEKYIKLTSKAL